MMKKWLCIYLMMFSWAGLNAQLCSGFLANITVTGGSFPGEISWQLMNGSTQLMAGEAPVTGQVCLPNLCQNYTLLMFDTFGDGWNGANFTLSYGSWTASTTLNGGSSGSSVLFAGISGCTDPFACNYNSSATCNAGCIYGFSGCTDPDACNYEPLACFDNASCCYGYCAIFSMTDTFGDGWNGGVYTITNSSAQAIYTGTLTGGSSGSQKLCLPSGCYTLSVTGGSFPAEIGWSLTGQVQMATWNGGAPVSIPFNTIDLISGCTDEFACNYNPNADCENGTCYYGFGGCTDVNACNFDPEACIDNGSCLYGNLVTLEVFDPILPGTFVLYEHTLAMEYGSPNYTSINEITEINYLALPYQVFTLCIPDGCYDFWITQVPNQNMTYSIHGFSFDVNNSPWFVGLEGIDVGTTVSGCTHPDACNYNSFANCDDGTCTFEGNEHCMHLNVSGIEGTGFFSDNSCMESISFIIRDLNNNVIETLQPTAYPSTDFYYTLPDGCYTCQVVHSPFCNFNFNFSGQNGAEVVGNQLTNTFAFTVGSSLGCTDNTASNYEPTKCVNDGSCCYSESGHVYLYDSPIDGWQGPYCNIYNGNNQLVYSVYLPYGEYDFMDKPCLPEGCYTYEVGTQLQLNYPENTFFQVGTNVQFDSGQLPATGTFAVGLACGDPFACNYNPLMTCEILTDCIYGFGGCTDPSSCAYDELACIDDGSCDDYTTVELRLYDESLNGWSGKQLGFFLSGSIVPDAIVSMPSGQYSYDFNVCIPNGCYSILDISTEIDDPNAYVEFLSSGEVYGVNSLLLGGQSGTIISGCTSSDAANYDPQANCQNYQCCMEKAGYVSLTGLTFGESATLSLYYGGELYEAHLFSSNVDQQFLCLPEGCLTYIWTVPFGTEMNWTFEGDGFGPLSGSELEHTGGTVVGLPIGGCNDITASNFNPFACFNDGSCCYGTTVEVYIGAFWSAYPYDNTVTFQLKNEANEVVINSVLVAGEQTNVGSLSIYGPPQYCLPNGCYTYSFSGNLEDYYVAFDISTNHSMADVLEDQQGVVYIGADWPEQIGFEDEEVALGSGCTDPYACNYNSNVICDDGSCISSGCTDPEACNFNPLAICDNGTCELGNPLNFVFTGLNAPETATVFILDALGEVEIYSQQVDASNAEVSFCLHLPGCYTYLVVPGTSSTYNFTVTGMLEGIFVGNQTTGATGISTEYAIADCADPTASNYFQHACSDNGFCCPNHNVIVEIYPLTASAGIENVTTSVYDWDGNLILQLESNMSAVHQTDYYALCLEDGCYFYTSYSEEAFSEYAVRLTDHDRNYPGNPIDIIVAQGNMGVAEFMQIGTIVPGCANPGACNYNPLANCDDNTCSTSCIGDLDCSGTVGIGDLLIFASQFGCTADCGISDLNQDGFVNTTDLLIFISKFGIHCP